MTWLARLSFILCAVFTVWTIVLVVQFGDESLPPGAPMAEGFETPILALEFAGSESDLAFLEGEVGAPLRQEMQRVQALDFWFPIAYAGLAFWFFIGAFLRGQKLAVIGVLLAMATIFADWNENAAIDAMLIMMNDGASAASLLPDLAIGTWIKWGLIAAYALWFAILMGLEKRRILALPGLLPAGLIVAAGITGGSPMLIEMISLPLALLFLTILLTAMIYLLASFKTEMGPNESARQVET